MVDSPERIAALLHGTPLLVMLDIDGTLSDLAPVPDEATVPEIARVAVQRLSNTTGVHVALVTGRAVRDARRMVPVRGVHIHGNHGIEIAHASGETEIEGSWNAEAAAVGAAAGELAKVVDAFPGALLEHKNYSLSVHYRHVAPTSIEALVAQVRTIAASHGVAVEGGKSVLNILPKTAVNKGTAAMRLVHEVFGGRIDGAILFAGDDVTDEHAFRALFGLPRAVTVKVGTGEDATAAKYRLDRPGDVHRLLVLLAERSA